jgi:hypothetical protein
MSNRPADLFLQDIRESIARIERYTSGLEQAAFEAELRPPGPQARSAIGGGATS